jgi:ferredoxin--NADP+ reductase
MDRGAGRREIKGVLEVLLNQANQPRYLVAVVGAGPAGIYAAKQLTGDGAHVVLFNRDVKPGGLAEYGIYPDKYKMRDGLRAQFSQILNAPDIEYFGNVRIEKGGDMTLDVLRGMGFQAILVTVGAQGTKWLGLPGEALEGVYHAKDIVYHYNRLPPFGHREFAIGRRVAVVGAGNVMLDIVHWLADRVKVDEVTTIARRGPAEVKFGRSELGYVIRQMDMAVLEAELARVTPLMASLGQNPEEFRSMIRMVLLKSDPPHSPTRFTMQFLASPTRILGDAQGRMCGLEVEENTLVMQDGEARPKGLGILRQMDFDTVIFAIGDRVDNDFGLPVAGNEYVKNPQPRFPVEGISYEAFDPQAGRPLEGLFVAGWSRKASTGLVGIARRDGINGAKAVAQYLQTLPPLAASPEEIVRAICEHIRCREKPAVSLADLALLDQVERQEAAQRGLVEFKFDNNDEMLTAMEKVNYSFATRSA